MTTPERAVSFSGVMAKTAFGFIRGKPVFSEEEMVNKRLQICGNCVYKQTNPKTKRWYCPICGCDLNGGVLQKVKFVEAHCPERRW